MKDGKPIVLWGLLVVLAASALFWEARAVSCLDLDGETALSEGVTLYGLLQVRDGHSPYVNFSAPPYAFSPYLPLTYYPPGWLARWLGADMVSTIVIGRLFTFAAWSGIAAFIWSIARQMGAGQLGAALGMLLWLAGNLTPEYAITFRPDAAALFFSLGGVWLYGRQSSRAGTACLLALAFLYKQTATAALLVILWEECRQRRFAGAATLAAIWGGLVFSAVVVSQWLSGGVFLSNVAGWLGLFAEWRWPAAMLVTVLVLHPGCLLGGIVGSVSLPSGGAISFLKRYFFIALASAFLRTTNPGTSPNHYLEPAAVGCILAALTFDRWPVLVGQRWVRVGWLGLTLGAVMLTFGQRVARLPAWSPEIFTHRAGRADEARAWNRLLEDLRAWNDPLLIEDPYLALRCGRPLYMTDSSAFAVMQQRGRFDDTAVCHQIVSGGFGAIVAFRPLADADQWRFFPERWVALMRPHYRLATTYRLEHNLRTYYVYSPP